MTQALGRALLVAFLFCGCGADSQPPAKATSPILLTLAIAPVPVRIDEGSTQQLAVLARYSDGSVLDATTQATWASTARSVAAVSASGVLRGVAPGTAIISAAFAGATANIPVHIDRQALISITFDDGKVTQLAPAQLMVRFGVRGTFYVVKHWVANAYAGCMSDSDLKALATDGHEIGSHSEYHRHLPTLGDADLAAELVNSHTWLRAHVPGAAIESFASPFGEYDARVLALAPELYGTHRTTQPRLNYPWTSLFELGDFGATSIYDIEHLIDQAVAERAWLIVNFHDFDLTESGASGFSIADFVEMLNYISVQEHLRVVTVAEGAASMRRLSAVAPTP